MSPPQTPAGTPVDTYYHDATDWARDRENELRQSRRVAWIAASVAAAIAVVEAAAIVMLVPLKTSVPYLLTVDRQTGYVQALDPLDASKVAPDAALTRSFLAQYVIAREGYSSGSLRRDYRQVSLWSTGEARARYAATMQVSNPESPLATLPRDAQLEVRIQSLTSLGPDSALVRFATVRTDSAGQTVPPRRWSAVITYHFSSAAMSAADRLDNPIGFQVTRYRRDPEMAPDPASVTTAETPASSPAAISPSGASPAMTSPALTGAPQRRPWP